MVAVSLIEAGMDPLVKSFLLDGWILFIFIFLSMNVTEMIRHERIEHGKKQTLILGKSSSLRILSLTYERQDEGH